MKAAKTWTPSKVQGLYRHIPGTYYGRVSIAGKETWRSLKTKVFEIAIDERLTGDGAIAHRELQIKSAPRMKKRTREYWGEIIAAFKKSWPGFRLLPLQVLELKDFPLRSQLTGFPPCLPGSAGNLSTFRLGRTAQGEGT